jgi:hypothetical protein
MICNLYALICWQNFILVKSGCYTEYVVVGSCCGQLLWMRQTLEDYGYSMNHVPLLCDNECHKYCLQHL